MHAFGYSAKSGGDIPAGSHGAGRRDVHGQRRAAPPVIDVQSARFGGSRSIPCLDGPWVARQGPEGRGRSGRDGPEGIGTPARNPGSPATREEAHGTPSARPRPASKLGIHFDARASARRTRRSGSCEPWIARVRVFRCGRSCGSWNARVDSMPGDACSTHVRLTISRPVRTRRPID